MIHRFRQQIRGINPYWGVCAAAALFVLLILGVHRESPRTLISFHGLLHAGIAGQFIGQTPQSFPPENPFFAGRPLCYYWFFHFLAAQLTRLLGMNIFHAMEAIIIFAAIGLIFSASALGRRLFNSTLAGLFIAYLILAGTNPLGIVYAIIKVATSGLERLCDDPNYLWGVVHSRFGLIRFKDVGGLYGPLINFFLNITSRAVALTALLATVLALERSLRRKQFVWHLLLLCAAAFTTALSPIIGVLIVSVWLVVLAVVRPEGNPELAREAVAPQPQLRRVLPLSSMISLMAGVLFALPTYYHLILGPSASQIRFWLFTSAGMLQLVTVMLSILPLLILAYVGWQRSPSNCRPFLMCLLASAVLLLLGNIAFQLPSSNQSNCFHAAVVLLSVPAGASILRSIESSRYAVASPRRALLIGMIFIPTVLVLLSSYVGRPPVPATFVGQRISRTEEDPQWAALYRWVRSETPAEAVFVMDSRSPLIAFCGNTTEFPAATGRCVFTEQLQHYLVSPYPDAKQHADLAVDLVSGKPISTLDTRYLQSLDRPLYLLLTRAEQMSGIEHLSQRYGPAVFRRSTLCVFRYRE